MAAKIMSIKNLKYVLTDINRFLNNKLKCVLLNYLRQRILWLENDYNLL